MGWTRGKPTDDGRDAHSFCVGTGPSSKATRGGDERVWGKGAFEKGNREKGVTPRGVKEGKGFHTRRKTFWRVCATDR